MSIEQAAREYIRIRRLKLDLKYHCNGLHWECGGDDGGPACCVFSGQDEIEWCPLCLESDVAHRWYLLAAQQQGVALRRLEREVNQ